MRVVDWIAKTREGEALTDTELDALVAGYTSGAIPDYQMSAWAMAVYYKGLSARETARLTAAMAHSGEVCDLQAIPGIKVDKHSTGGVGDTTTLIVAPLAAALGVPVAKMSGRGLGHTGGTIDKLESIAGLRTELSLAEFVAQVQTVGLAVMGQSDRLTPADKKLYALRDVTATVQSIPLIASSIMSKKIAAGADAIVLDVKTGDGAFMQSAADARRLAKAMVDIGTQLGRKTVALISSMEQPLGRAIGNALEVAEAIAVLNNHAHGDLRSLSVELAAQMAVLAGRYPHLETARQAAEQAIVDGRALATFKEFVAAQGGDVRQIEEPHRLPQAAMRTSVYAPASGYVSSVRTSQLGHAAMLLGAGRADKTASIDLAVGIFVLKRIGDRVTVGEPLCEIHSNDTDGEKLTAIAAQIEQCFILSDEPQTPPPLFIEWLTE